MCERRVVITTINRGVVLSQYESNTRIYSGDMKRIAPPTSANCFSSLSLMGIRRQKPLKRLRRYRVQLAVTKINRGVVPNQNDRCLVIPINHNPPGGLLDKRNFREVKKNVRNIMHIIDKHYYITE